jgi:hypothetical protein
MVSYAVHHGQTVDDLASWDEAGWTVVQVLGSFQSGDETVMSVLYKKHVPAPLTVKTAAPRKRTTTAKKG